MYLYPFIIMLDAEEAGIKVPENPNIFSREAYPHFSVLCNICLGNPRITNRNQVIHNIKIISKIPNNKIRTITFGDMSDKLYL